MTTDASLVYITRRSLTMVTPGMVVYHLRSRVTRYAERTGCGITIWSSDQRELSVVPIRRDIATCFARLCEVCFMDAPQ